MSRLVSLADEALIAVDTIAGRATSLFTPSVRLGVTGLSRAGKTVFIASLVHNLVHGGRLPLFDAMKTNRIARAFLEPQPDDAVPRFQYEDHVGALVDQRVWPDSTRAISELRLTIDYESASAWGRWFSSGRLHLDIVDYPGEWLLDLPLLGKDHTAFSRDAFDLSRSVLRHDLAAEWHAAVEGVENDKPANEALARQLAEKFTAYLRACRADNRALSTLPPGRFLMPGDLDGSPALTFAPLPDLPDSPAKPGSLRAMMERRYESYKNAVVKPFFREHVARLDRQIVLVDAMQAMNAGPGAMLDLERALSEILPCFRPGSANPLTALWTRRISRVLIAATKADQLHHESHPRLQAIVRKLVDRSIERAGVSGASVDVLAMAAVRSTREAKARHDGEELPVIVGTPLAGEVIDGVTFDGNTETAIFPGDLPERADAVFGADGETVTPLRFVRFRPPRLERTAEGATLSLPHIRLDRALQFLIGDYLA